MLSDCGEALPDHSGDVKKDYTTQGVGEGDKVDTGANKTLIRLDKKYKEIRKRSHKVIESFPMGIK